MPFAQEPTLCANSLQTVHSVQSLTIADTDGGKRGDNPMAYTAESLAALSDMDLDDMIEELVMDRESGQGFLQRIKRGAARARTGSFRPTAAVMQGWASSWRVCWPRALRWLSRPVAWCGWPEPGREIKHVGGVAMPRAVAIAAVLAVQGG